VDGEGDAVPVPRRQVVVAEEEVPAELRAAAVGPRAEEVVEENGVRVHEADVTDAADLVHGWEEPCHGGTAGRCVSGCSTNCGRERENVGGCAVVTRELTLV
jgi:hypothetical protein